MKTKKRHLSGTKVARLRNGGNFDYLSTHTKSKIKCPAQFRRRRNLVQLIFSDSMIIWETATVIVATLAARPYKSKQDGKYS